MIRKYLMSLLCIFTLLFSGFSFAQSKEQILLDNLPSQYMGYEASPVDVYPEPELGVSRTYKNHVTNSTITLYLYHWGQSTIKDGITDPTVVTAYRSAQSDIEKVYRTGMYGLSGQTAQLKKYNLSISRASKNKQLPFLVTSYEFKLADFPEQLYSRVYVSGVHNLIFKVRITELQSKRSSEEEIQNFLGMIVKDFDSNMHLVRNKKGK